MSEQSKSAQIILVAECLTTWQSIITDYELKNYASLDDNQKQVISATLSTISASAARLYADAAIAAFENIKESLTNLQKATEKTEHYLHTIADIQKAINVVATLASLTNAIMDLEPTAITNKLDGLLNLVG